MTATTKELRTVRGYDARELISWLQKAIRRGLEADALWVAAELERSGFGPWVWARLSVIASEDIGLADPGIAAEVHALRETWAKTEKNRKHSGRLMLVHAVLLLVRAPKSRLVDWALISVFESDELREVPSFARDRHTRAGRRAGKGWEAFFREGSQLDPHAEQPGEAEHKQRAWDALHTERAPVDVEDDEPDALF